MNNNWQGYVVFLKPLSVRDPPGQRFKESDYVTEDVFACKGEDILKYYEHDRGWGTNLYF